MGYISGLRLRRALTSKNRKFKFSEVSIVILISKDGRMTVNGGRCDIYAHLRMPDVDNQAGYIRFVVNNRRAMGTNSMPAERDEWFGFDEISEHLWDGLIADLIKWTVSLDMSNDLTENIIIGFMDDVWRDYLVSSG